MPFIKQRQKAPRRFGIGQIVCEMSQLGHCVSVRFLFVYSVHSVFRVFCLFGVSRVNLPSNGSKYWKRGTRIDEEGNQTTEHTECTKKSRLSSQLEISVYRSHSF